MDPADGKVNLREQIRMKTRQNTNILLHFCIVSVIILFFLLGLLFIVFKTRTEQELNLLRSKMDKDLLHFRSKMDEDLELYRSRTDQEQQQTSQKIAILQRDFRILNDWYSVGFCVLANGDCPAGFTHHINYIRAIKLYSAPSRYITTGNFGSSRTGVHNAIANDADLQIESCCKNSAKLL